MGRRPDTYTSERGIAFCERVGNGELVKKICEDVDQPAWRTIGNWLARHPDFAKMYGLARERQAHWLFEEAIQLARDLRDGEIKIAKNANVIINTFLAAAGRLKPNEYGERVVPSRITAIHINTTLALKPGDDAKVIDGESQTYTLEAPKEKAEASP